MDGFLEYRRRSASYARSIRQTRNRLTGLHGRLLSEIMPETISREVDGMTPEVRNLSIRILHALFAFGIRRGYCAENPVRRVDRAQREPSEIAIYSAQEVASILTTAQEYAPQLIPFLVVSFFCGLRRAEALRLEWPAIDLTENYVRLPAAITKTKRRRHIEISENARAWLAPYAHSIGRICPHSGGALADRLCVLARKHGIATIKHGARHSFASYWLAMHGEIDQLCLFLGHTNPKVTFHHYAKAATRREAEKFWAIMPASQSKVVAFTGEKGAA